MQIVDSQIKNEDCDFLSTRSSENELIIGNKYFLIKVEREGKQFIVENGLIQVYFNEHGEIVQFYDVKNSRHLVQSSSPANVMRFYEDIPLFWDAWDVALFL